MSCDSTSIYIIRNIHSFVAENCKIKWGMVCDKNLSLINSSHKLHISLRFLKTWTILDHSRCDMMNSLRTNGYFCWWLNEPFFLVSRIINNSKLNHSSVLLSSCCLRVETKYFLLHDIIRLIIFFESDFIKIFLSKFLFVSNIPYYFWLFHIFHKKFLQIPLFHLLVRPPLVVALFLFL